MRSGWRSRYDVGGKELGLLNQWKRELDEVGLTGPRYRQPRAGLGLAATCAAEKECRSQAEQGDQPWKARHSFSEFSFGHTIMQML